MKEFKKEQLEVCLKYGSEYTLIERNLKIGIAIDTIEKLPINGLRHPPEKDTCGWYIWGGEEFSTDANFFSPLHIYHLEKYYPTIIKFLGLSPGWRFLTDGQYEDVWFDKHLLDI